MTAKSPKRRKIDRIMFLYWFLEIKRQELYVSSDPSANPDCCLELMGKVIIYIQSIPVVSNHHGRESIAKEFLVGN